MTNTVEQHVAQRLPLADATLQLLAYALEPNLLQTVYQQHRGPSYERLLDFPQFVQLVRDALFGTQPSTHRSFQHAADVEQLPVSVTAMYGNLRRVPLSLSCAFFHAANERLFQVASHATPPERPPALRNFQVLAFDGKKIKYVAQKLKAVRGLKGKF